MKRPVSFAVGSVVHTIEEFRPERRAEATGDEEKTCSMFEESSDDVFDTNTE